MLYLLLQPALDRMPARDVILPLIYISTIDGVGVWGYFSPPIMDGLRGWAEVSFGNKILLQVLFQTKLTVTTIGLNLNY